MSAITIIALAIVAVIVVASIVALGLPVLLGGITGSGHLVTKQENFTGFTSVTIADGFRCTISRSATYSVNVTIDDNLVNYIQVTRTGNVLSVGLVPGHFVLASPQVSISMPDISSVDVSGGTTGSAAGFASSHPISVTASGGSALTWSGRATNLTAEASGGSRLDLSNLHVTNAQVDLSGGSSATVNVAGRLDANLSGGSQLNYLGNPTLGNIDTSGGSGISRQ
jgi:hypothetical protein